MKSLLRCLTCLALVVLTRSILAHHSAIVFDTSGTILRTGTVTQFILRNPHMILTLDVVNDKGEVEEWKVEGQSIAAMQAMGFNRDSVAVGDEVTVKIFPLKSGEPGGLIEGMIGADKTAYNMEAPQEAAPQVHPALTEWIPPPEDETWQIREQKTRPASLPIISEGLAPGDSPASGKMAGALDPENLAKQRPPAPFDLTGVWQFRGEDEWRANYGSYEFKPMPQLTPKAEAFYQQYIELSRKGERFADPTLQCYPAGMPRFMVRYGSMLMMQYPTAIFMVSRLNNEYRVIFLDDRERLPEEVLDRNWNGESIGHWEGDTLVIETTGFIGENHYITGGVPVGKEFKIVERIQVINDGNTMVTEYIFTDPENWVGEWKHVKFRDRVLRSDVREANCIPQDNLLLPGVSAGASN